MAGRPWQVRWYYDVWTLLPAVQRGLWGRGVIAVNEAGHRRLAGLPPLQADDLAASLMFEPHETALVPGARVIIHPPTTFAGLLCRRARCVTGAAQIERAQGLDGSADQTRISDLTAIIRRRPGMLPRVGYFLSVAVFARLRASRALARGDFVTWLRDESSRTASGTAAAQARRAAVRSQACGPRGHPAPSAGPPGPCPAQQVIRRVPVKPSVSISLRVFSPTRACREGRRAVPAADTGADRRRRDLITDGPNNGLTGDIRGLERPNRS